MTSLYGQRWADSYGSEPDELWQHAISASTEAELKRSIKALMTRGGAHPPTLPEFLELAKPGQAEKAKAKHPEPFTPEWNDQRRAAFDRIAKQSRDRNVVFPDAVRESSRASLAHVDNPAGTVGFEEARQANEAAAARRMAPLLGMTVDALLAKWRSEAAAHRAAMTRNAA